MHKNLHKDYYEAIYQIRPRRENLLDFLRDHCKKAKVAIVKEVSKDYGFDLYLSSRKSAVMISKRMRKAFGGTVRISKTLHTRDRLTSKLIYRLTVLYRLE